MGSLTGKNFRFLILLAGLIFLWYLGRFFHLDTDAIQNSLAKFPLIFSGLIFIFLYCLVTFFVWFSKDIFRVIAAVLFGPYYSTLFVFSGEVINALILFGLARYLGGPFFAGKVQPDRKNFSAKIARTNFFWLFLFRFTPLIPFRFMDIAAGAANIPFRRYFSAVILGSPVRIFWLQYILSGVGKAVLDDPMRLQEYLLKNRPMFIFSFIYFILVIFVAFRMKKKEAPCDVS